MKNLFVVIIAMSFVTLFSGCEDHICPGCVDNGSGGTNPPPGEYCDNGTDDDNDGFIDCADPDCRYNPVCMDEICDDGIDNDGDDDVDCDDEDCDDDSACGSDPVENCMNGEDDDGDGDVDCDDPDCYTYSSCRDDEFNTFITVNDPDGSSSQFEVGGVEHSGTDAGSWVSRVVTGFVVMFNVYDENIPAGTANHDAVFYMASSGCTTANILRSTDSDSRIDADCTDGAGDDYNCTNEEVYAFCGPGWSGVHAQVNLMGLVDDTDLWSVYIALSLGEIPGLENIVGNTTLTKSAVEALSSADQSDLWGLFSEKFIKRSQIPRYTSKKSSGSDQVMSLPSGY